jgi:hypothetical protein
MPHAMSFRLINTKLDPDESRLRSTRYRWGCTPRLQRREDHKPQSHNQVVWQDARYIPSLFPRTEAPYVPSEGKKMTLEFQTESTALNLPLSACEALPLISETLPMAHDYGARTGKIEMGGAVALIGTRLPGPAALLTEKFQATGEMIGIHREAQRLAIAKRLDTTWIVHHPENQTAETVLKMIRWTPYRHRRRGHRSSATTKPVAHATDHPWRHKTATPLRPVDAEFLCPPPNRAGIRQHIRM